MFDLNNIVYMIFVFLFSQISSIAITRIVNVMPLKIEFELIQSFVSVFGANKINSVNLNEYKRLNSKNVSLFIVPLSLGLYFLFMHDIELFAAILIFTYLLFALVMVDIKSQYLPDTLNYSLLWIGVLASLFGITDITISESVLGVIGGYVLIFFIAKIMMILGAGGIARGDFKLLAAIGAWVGLGLVPQVLLGSILSVMIIVPILKKTGEIEKNNAFAFGQFIALSGYLLTIYHFAN